MPTARAHVPQKLVDAFLPAAAAEAVNPGRPVFVGTLDAAAPLLNAPDRAAVLRAVLDRLAAELPRRDAAGPVGWADGDGAAQLEYLLCVGERRLTDRPVDAGPGDLAAILNALAAMKLPPAPTGAVAGTLTEAVIAATAKGREVPPELRTAAAAVARHLRAWDASPEPRTAAALDRAGWPDGRPVLDAGEAWSDAVLADLAAADDPRPWHMLLLHAATAAGPRPTGRWRRAAAALCETIGRDAVRAALRRWFPLTDRPRTDPIPVRAEVPTLFRPLNPDPPPDLNRRFVPHHRPVLKGLAWLAAAVVESNDAELFAALESLAATAWRAESGLGPRAVAVGNAAAWALGELPGGAGTDPLRRLRAAAPTGPTRRAVDAALAAAG